MTFVNSSTDRRRVAAQYRMAPLAMLGVPVAASAALTAWLGTPEVLPAALGAAGWTIALALSPPLALIATRLDDDRGALHHGRRAGDRQSVAEGRPQVAGSKEILRDQGMIQDNGPAWGVVERFSAAGMHIGFTLLLFAQPWLVLVTIVLHSAINLLAVRYVKRWIARMELAMLAFAIVVLVASVVAAGLTA